MQTHTPFIVVATLRESSSSNRNKAIKKCALQAKHTPKCTSLVVTQNYSQHGKIGGTNSHNCTHIEKNIQFCVTNTVYHIFKKQSSVLRNFKKAIEIRAKVCYIRKKGGIAYDGRN